MEPQLPPPTPQLPVVDLIGLRFSLQHLRLVGYGLLAVWLAEIVTLLTSPGLGEIGTRLHFISQFLDLSPILLVAIGLVAFQGGLRRAALEVTLLPLLLTLLPLLSAFHFFLAPVSLANAVTLVQKQQQIGNDQIERIDRQVDRASTILRESDSIDALLGGLQRIPGLQVRVPSQASVDDARREVRQSLQRERERVRQRIRSNVSSTRDAFLRRAVTNALLALLVGLLLFALHHGALREMEQAIPFLDWVLVHGQSDQNPEMLQQLLRFQRACVALGWFSLLERCGRYVRRVVRRPTAEEEEQQAQEQARLASLPPPSPFEDGPRRPASVPFGMRSLLSPFPVLRHSGFPQADPDDPQGLGYREAPLRESPFGPGGFEGEGGGRDPDAPHPIAEAMRRGYQAEQRREERRRQQDLQRYRALMRRREREGFDPFALFGGRDPEGESDGLSDRAWAERQSSGNGNADHEERFERNSRLDQNSRPDRNSRLERNSRADSHSRSDRDPAFGLEDSPAGGWASGPQPQDREPPLSWWQRRRRERDHLRARRALRAMAHSEEASSALEDEEEALLGQELTQLRRRRPPAPLAPLAGLMRRLHRML